MSEVKLTEVNSSNVAAVGFENGVMTVRYKNNRTYSYHGVPDAVYGEMMKAESIGSFLAANIKGQYSTQPIKADETTVQENNDDETGNNDGASDVNSQSDADAGNAGNTDADETSAEGGEAGGDDQPKSGDVSDESDTDNSEAADTETEGGKLEETASTDGETSGEPAEQFGPDAPETSTDTQSPDDGDGDDADSSELPKTAGENLGVSADTQGSSEAGDEGADIVNLGIDADEDQLEIMQRKILEHFEADKFEINGATEDGVCVFAVLKTAEDGTDVEVITGTFLTLHELAVRDRKDIDQTPTAEQSENLETLRSLLIEYGVDLQYERAEAKDGSLHWNLTASVEKSDHTVSHSTRIVENATKDEIQTAFEEIITVFVRAS